MSRRFPSVSQNILDAIGDTPLLSIDGIYCKIEFLNPSGSIKARIAKYMIEKPSTKVCCTPATQSSKPPAAIPATRCRW